MRTTTAVVLLLSAAAAAQRSAPVPDEVQLAIETILDPRAHPDLVEESRATIGRFGPHAVVALVDGWVRQVRGGSDDDRLPFWYQSMLRVRDVALAAGPAGEAAVERLLASIRQKDRDDDWHVWRLLAELAPWYARFEPDLAALPDPRPSSWPPRTDVRGYARAWSLDLAWHQITALRDMMPHPRGRELLPWLHSSDPLQVEFAALLLAHDPPHPDAADRQDLVDRLVTLHTQWAPWIVALADDNAWWESRVHRAAGDALIALASDQVVAVPALTEELAADRSTRRRIVAARALARLGPSAAPAVPALIELRAPWEEREARLAAVQALGAIGEAARPALSALRDIAADDSFDVVLAQQAQEAIAAITR